MVSVDMPCGISFIKSLRNRSVRIGHLADIGLGMDPLIHVEQGKLFVDGPGLGGATNGITVMQPRHAAVVVNNSMVDDDINLANATGLAFTGGLSARYGGTVTGDVDLGPIGAFVGGRNVNDSDATSFRIDGPIHGGTLTVVGNGGLAVRGAGNTYSGETIIGTNGDTTVLALEENGRLSTTSRIVINPAATLRIGNQMYVSAGDHVADTIPVELNGGKVQLVSGGPDELIGLTTLHRGASILAVSTTQGNVPARTLTIESLARLAGAVLQVDVSYYDDGTPGSHRVKLSTPPTLTAGIVGAWTIAEPGHDGDFASYDPTLGFTRLPEFGRPDDLNTASTTDNVRIDTAQTLTANRHINSLTVHTQDRILLDGHKLTVESGGIILWGGGPLEEIGAGTLTAGATSGGELFFHLHRSANIEADVVDNGAMPVSLVVSSMDGETGILHLSGVNTYSGSTTINGEMSIDEAHSIPTGTDLTINGGLFRTSRGEETVVLGDVTLRDGGWIAPGSLDVRSDYFAVDAESFLIESGHIRSNLTGSGPMTKTTRGTLEIAGLNDGYTGTIDVYDGILHVAGQTALGQGLTTVHPDAILIFEGEDIDGNVLLAGGTIGATEDDASFSGTMSMSGAATVLTFDGLDPEFNNSMRDVEYHQVTFIGSVSLQSGASLSVLDSGGGEFHLACDVDLGPNGLVEGARFDLEDGKTLSGSGSIVGVVDVDNGTLSPGNSAGSLTISELLLSATSHLEFELGSQSDQIAVTDYLVLDGTIDIEALSGFGPGSYRLLTFPAGGEGFLDNGLLLGEIPFGFSPGNFSIEVGDGFVDLNVIPEPSSLTVLAFASVCALARRRRGG
mgnify:FL=1